MEVCTKAVALYKPGGDIIDTKGHKKEPPTYRGQLSLMLFQKNFCFRIYGMNCLCTVFSSGLVSYLRLFVSWRDLPLGVKVA